MDEIINYIKKNKQMSIATYSSLTIDNAVVSYYSEGTDIYFGTFRETLKSKNIKKNSIVAITINALQIHGNAMKLRKKQENFMI